ncbi:MAG: hypothetical protein R6V19_14095 [Armatimonadota bacterium]
MNRLFLFTVVVVVGLLLCANTLADTALVVDDGFDAALDGSLWEQRIAAGIEQDEFAPGRGQSVSVEGGRLSIRHDVSDGGGAVVTNPIQPVNGKVLVIAKRTYLAPADEAFVGQTAILTPAGERANGVCYWHVSPPGAGDSVDAFIVGMKARYTQEPQMAPVWNTWFDEIIIWDPASETLTYNTQGNTPVSSCSYGLRNAAFRIGFSAFGMTPGHEHQIDEVKMFWTAADKAMQLASRPSAALELQTDDRQAAGGITIPDFDWPVPPGAGKAETPARRPADVQICSSPFETFSPAGLVRPVPYGTFSLVGRYEYGQLQNPQTITVQWTHNGQVVSTEQMQMTTDSQYLDSGISADGGFLPPGDYVVCYQRGTDRLAQGAISILQPQPLQGDAQTVYQNALSEVQKAADAIDRGDSAAAKRLAEPVVPVLASVFYNTQSANALSMHQIARSIVAIGEMEVSAAGEDTGLSAEWALRAYMHARLAQVAAEDDNIRAAAAFIVTTLETQLPELKQAF